MYILAIETSCDDTGVSILKNNEIIVNLIFSQYKKYKKFKGVVPEIASRMHEEKIYFLISKAIEKSKIEFEILNYIAFTKEPGLINTLHIGLIVAKSLSQILNIPFIPINHLEAHIYSSYIGLEYKKVKEKTEPKLALIVSGGHTQLLLEEKLFKFKLIGDTRDDTIGETFDQVGRLLKINYPAGKKIDQLAKKGKKTINFKITQLNNYDFSFSGLKSQVKRYVESNKFIKNDLLFSFQYAAVSQIENQIKNYLVKNKNIETLLVGGWVSANSYLRNKLKNLNLKNLNFAQNKYCQDNAAMIGYLAYLKISENKKMQTVIF